MSTRSETPGLTLTKGEYAADDVLLKVVRRSWRDPFTIASDFAQAHTPYVAVAACKGLITTRIKDNVYARTWHITSAGLRMLNERELDE